MSFLPFTYDEPGAEDAPLWMPGTPRDTPVAIIWNPSLCCTAEQHESGQTLTKPPGIPWNDLNIAEIRVESRKVYEVLRRVTPPGQSFFVRINPPDVPAEPHYFADNASVIFTTGEKKETDLAVAIAHGLREKVTFNICTGFSPEQLKGYQLIIFCFRAIETINHLKETLSISCPILSSDAGAAEEYLSQKAEPGRWHVAKTWNSPEWENMALDLLGMGNQVFQSSVVDQTPYVNAWGGK